MANEKPTNTFWGYVLGFGAGVATFPFGLAKGIYHVAVGEEFADGLDIVERAGDAAQAFGDEHDKAITGGVASGLTVMLITTLTGKPPQR